MKSSTIVILSAIMKSLSSAASTYGELEAMTGTNRKRKVGKEAAKHVRLVPHGIGEDNKPALKRYQSAAEVLNGFDAIGVHGGADNLVPLVDDIRKELAVALDAANERERKEAEEAARVIAAGKAAAAEAAKQAKPAKPSKEDNKQAVA